MENTEQSAMVSSVIVGTSSSSTLVADIYSALFSAPSNRGLVRHDVENTTWAE